MEEKNGEERTTNERLTIKHRSNYSHRPLSTRKTEDSTFDDRKARSITLSYIDDDRRSSNRRNSTTLMKPSSSQHALNSSNFEKDSKTKLRLYQEKTNGNNEETFNFRREMSKLRSAKSQGELYQPHYPLPLPSTSDEPSEENQRTKRLSESPTTRNRSNTTNLSMNEQTIAATSSGHKNHIWKRFKEIITSPRKTKDSKKKNSTSLKVPPLKFEKLSIDEPNRTVPDGTSNHLLQNPIRLNELRSWLLSKNFPEQKIRDEYDKLPIDPLYPKTAATRPENRYKNRFNSIEPYDHSRVILDRLSSDPFSDYINASFIDGFRIKKLYIASQAPTETTLNDFFRMIFQLRIQSIIMVTRLFEDGKHKSIQYWPDEGEKRVNDFRIRLDNEEKYADYTIRRFILSNSTEPSDVLVIKQYHFLSWPDHGCLSLSTPLLDFRQRFRVDYKAPNPILVHCSAGVGRSGTFIALDSLLEAAEHQDTIDVLEFTNRMRQNRVYMIQTAEQYVFLYRTLIEGILTMDSTISLQEFLQTKKIPIDIKSQYKLLEQLQSDDEFTYRGALDPSNINKNRSESILAADQTRPYLMTQVEKSTDYINAIFVNSYRHVPSYIVTQYPFPYTCIDFWRLVFDHNVSIIMLLESIPRDSRNLPYWPTNPGQITPMGPFEIVMTSQKEDEYLMERVFDIKIVNKNVYSNDRTRTIRQFQVKENSDLLFIVKRFLKEMRTYTEQNVILQCLNGTTFSGYFAALCNSIDKMQTEQIVDPFKIVRLLRSVRPQFIDQNQYENLFRSMFEYAQRYLQSSLYSNTSSGYDQSTIDNRVIQRL